MITRILNLIFLLMLLPLSSLAGDTLIPAAMQTFRGEDPDNTDHIQTSYRDLDEDGVKDQFDHCLNSLPGRQVDQFGCEADDDNDGIPNRIDQCPETQPQTRVNFLGCIPDRDGDGIPDDKDQCPETFGDHSSNHTGCSPSQNRLNNIEFELNDVDVTEFQKQKLHRSARALKRLAKDEAVVIFGHTDSAGSTRYNETLSWERAKQGKDYISVTYGVPANRIYVIGMGEKVPIANNLTKIGRSFNRRVELRIYRNTELPKEARLDPPEKMKWIKR